MKGLLLWISCCPLSLLAQMPLAQKTAAVVRVIQKNHIAPRPLDDQFSAVVFDEVVRRADPREIIFCAEDLQALQPFRLQIDDEIRQQKTGFVQVFLQRFRQASDRYVQTAAQLAAQPLSFDVKEQFTEPDPPARHAWVPLAQYKQRIQQYFKYRLLQQWAEGLEDDTAVLTPAMVKAREAEGRKALYERAKERWSQFSTGPDTGRLQRWMEDVYLSAITTAFDPHTTYMSNEEKDAFDEGLSSESLRFGFELATDESGQYKIADVLPGSSAWRSSNLFPGDQIIAIKPLGEKTINLQDAKPEEVNSLLSKYQDKTVEFTIKSADGSTKTVKLKKEVVRNDDNVVRGWILEGPRKIGYISLPSFYTEIGNTNIGTSCAEDVAREIVKLKQDNIEGLILDLRYNGGGSVQEAAEMLGIFIDIGPLGMVKVSSGETDVLKDVNRGTIFDGPLTIMINGASASASEILAGTLQDYGRAAIVGSNSFGKATMQVVMPVDKAFDLKTATAASLEAHPAPLGYVKVTMGKLYRVTGSSAQGNGVVPDVRLPDLFEAVEYTEKSLPNSLPPDTLQRKLPYRPYMQAMPAALRQLCQQQALADSAMLHMAAEVGRQRQQAHQYQVPLQLAAFNQWWKATAGDTYATAAPVVKAPYQVRNSRQDAGFNEIDLYHKEMDEALIEEMAEDDYIRQAYLLLQRWIEKK